MKGLVKVEIRCREHERYTANCPGCLFLCKAERDLTTLSRRRDQLFREMKARLSRQELIIIDLR